MRNAMTPERIHWTAEQDVHRVDRLSLLGSMELLDALWRFDHWIIKLNKETAMNKEIARVTSWNDCIVIGCRLENGHEGPHDFSVPASEPEPAAPDTADAPTTEDEWAESELETLRDGSVSRRSLSALPAGPAAAPGRFYVVRVNGRARDTYAATTLEEAVDIASADDGDRLEVGRVQAPDAGAARLMAPPLGWSGPFTIDELEERIRQNAEQQPACHCGQCGPVPAGAKRTPCTGARMAGPETSREDNLRFQLAQAREACTAKGIDPDMKPNAASSFQALALQPVWAAKARLAALALACLLPLLAASSAHAAGAPKAPRHGKPVAGCVKQASGKWAKLTPGGKWSTVACELEVTLRITDRVKAREGYELRYTSPERCTVWVAEKRADDAKVIGAAYDACIDTMAEKGGA